VYSGDDEVPPPGPTVFDEKERAVTGPLAVVGEPSEPPRSDASTDDAAKGYGVWARAKGVNVARPVKTRFIMVTIAVFENMSPMEPSNYTKKVVEKYQRDRTGTATNK
jgi:hypothetical protein